MCASFRHFRQLHGVFLGSRPFYLATSCTIDVILLDITNAIQSWSTLAGYEELLGGFTLIRNGEIFERKINKVI